MSSIKHRHLGRKSSHRMALLRNLVTSLFEHESISTTWPKAKEAQRLAEKLITLGKRNTNAARIRAQGIFFLPEKYLPKLFGPIRERYADRPGGYTRVLRIEPLKPDQAPSAILELVDGPKDMRFAMTAKTLAKHREETEAAGAAGNRMNEITAANIRKVTRFRPDGEAALQKEVERLEAEKRRQADEEKWASSVQLVSEEEEQDKGEEVDPADKRKKLLGRHWTRGRPRYKE